MKAIHRAITVTLSAAVAGIMFIPAASACASSTFQTSSVFQDARILIPLATPADSARDLTKESNPNTASIVGMWSFRRN